MPVPLRPQRPAGRPLSWLTGDPSDAAIRITGITLSSAYVRPGDLYVGLAGRHTHGARFAGDAAAAGAVAVLTDAEGAALAAGSGLPVVVDPDPRVRMAHVAAEIYGHPTRGLLSFALTGTNGKTTTAFLLEAALLHLGRHVGSIGTIGFRLDGRALDATRTTVTTPESPDLQALMATLVEQGADAVAMEVSSHALALHRVDGLHFDVAGFTNLGWDHRDFHPTQEHYFRTKARLFTTEFTSSAVVSTDDEWGLRLAREISRDGRLVLRTTGLDAGPGMEAGHYWAKTITPLLGGGSEIVVQGPRAELSFVLGLPGDHNVRNAVTAIAMLDAAGLDVAAAVEAFATATVPGRMQRVALPAAAPTVYVDFAHTPEAVSSVLASVTTGPGGAPVRTIAVLGCGGDRDTGKRGPMGAAAVEAADVLVVTDDNPRSEPPEAIRDAILAGAERARAAAGSGTRAARCAIIDGGDRRSAIALALAAAGPDDVVAVLGKGHEIGQHIGGDIVPFSDADVVVEQWQRLWSTRGGTRG